MILEAIINGKIIYNCITAEINTIFFRYLKHYNKDTHEGALISQKLEVHKYLLPGINFKKLKPLLYFLEMEKLRCKEIVNLLFVSLRNTFPYSGILYEWNDRICGLS